MREPNPAAVLGDSQRLARELEAADRRLEDLAALIRAAGIVVNAQARRAIHQQMEGLLGEARTICGQVRRRLDPEREP